MEYCLSVPKKNAEAWEPCSVRDGTERFLQHRAGKSLVLTEGTSFCAMLPAARQAGAVGVLFDGDALSLFALPDVSCVLASGSAQTLRAARFFAAVRRIPCAVFPAHAACDGAFGTRARLRVAGEMRDVPLAAAQVYCDVSLMRESVSEGYARLLLSRLALFEQKAAGLLCRRPFGAEAEEGAFALTDGVRGELPPEEIVRRNVQLRLLEEAGAPVGEGALLCGGGALRAYRTLLSLYTAFFRRGVPRRYFVPDYRARAAAAGVSYASLCIPSEEEYALRALRLERVRGELAHELVHLNAALAGQLRAVRSVGGRDACPELTVLKNLPELAPHGLCAIIRDFGLMETL